MSTEYEFHPACLMQPDMTDDHYAALRESIRAGYQEDKPIAVYEGVILDGRHRYKACQDAGIEPPFFTVPSDTDPYRYVFDVHEGRRHYKNQEQQALVNLPILEASDSWRAQQKAMVARANRDRQVAAKKQAREVTDTGKTVFKSQVVPQVEGQPGTRPKRDHTKKHANSTTAAKAQSIGVSRASVERAQTIQKADPDLADQVRQGNVSPTQAIREIKRAAIVTQLEDVKAREVDAPTGLYDVIVIDPPWPMKKIERDERPNQAEFGYPTMEENELSELDIPADEDCHVWLWTTHKFLPMALRLLDAWGLKYVCTFVWHKPGGFQPIGLPQYNCEFALYARKGSPKFIDTKALPTCFDAPRGAHSEKPKEFYDVVRRVTGGRRLDMFNRRDISGFDVWGNEAEL